MRSAVVIFVLFFPVWGLSCGGTSTTVRDSLKADMEILASEISGQHITDRFDLNGNGQPNMWKVWLIPEGMDADAAQDVRVLVRKDVDMNFDDKIDLRVYYATNGDKVKEEMDHDFDEKFDAVNHYQSGKLILREMGLAYDGKPKIWKYYDNGRLIRKERDEKGDGAADVWEYYREGKLERVGRDLDGDGEPEMFEEVGGEG